MRNNKKAPQITFRKKIMLIGGIVIGLIIVVSVAGVGYMYNLAGLVDQGEVTGNPSLQESDLVESDETMIPTTDSTTANNGTEATAGETLPTASVIETSPTTTEKLPDVRSSPNVYNILLIGTDNRGEEVNGRSDAMIIFSINKKTKKIHLVSLMRGLYVNIPGRGWSMLNNSFSYGGTKLLRQTIEDNLRVRINDYLLINFSSFTQAIDLVGGVEIELTESEADTLNTELGLALTAGNIRLDGGTSLAYTRIRHLDSDYRRTGRQRKVIESLIYQMRGLDAVQLDQTARQLLPLVKTNLSSTKVISLTLDLLKYRDYPISQLMLPIDDSFSTIIVRNIQMVQFDFQDNIAALHQILFDD
jgi:polyisoprenyl-teichoic acid--peptidoglycan teichoic acid transferase